MQTTNRKLIAFVNLATQYLKMSDENGEPQSAFYNALEDATEDFKPFTDAYTKQFGRLQRQFANKDKKTTVFTKDQNGNYEYTEKGANDLEDAVEKLLDEEITINPNYASEVPEDLHRSFMKGFTGFVIEPDYQPNQEAE